jgi:hypothetical protein
VVFRATLYIVGRRAYLCRRRDRDRRIESEDGEIFKGEEVDMKYFDFETI